MKRKRIEKIPFELPPELQKFTTGATLFDSSCSPEARVYFIDKDGGYYLKRGAHCALETEAALTDYFHKKGLGAEVLFYRMYADCDWLMTSRVAGEDCTHADYLRDPERLTDTIAERLRALHEVDFSVSDALLFEHTKHYFALAEHNYRAGKFDKSFLPRELSPCSMDEAFALLSEGRERFRSEVLLHGDYCLPNIMLDSWRFSGFIDLGSGGVGDRHVDLFWGAWTLAFNLGTDKYRQRFFDAYGRELVDADKLRLVGIAECFG